MATMQQLKKKEETIVHAIAGLNDKLAEKKEALKGVRDDIRTLGKAEKAAAKASKPAKSK